MKRPRRPDTSLVLSVALHLVLGAIAVRVIVFGYGAITPQHERIVPQHIGFLALPHNDNQQPTEGKSGGDGRPVRANTAPPPPLVAPSGIPTGVAPAPASTAEQGGSGELIGEGGPTRGVRPNYVDPRIWVHPDHIVSAPLTQSERLDSTLTHQLQMHNDTVLAQSGGRAPGDWTFDHNGKKYGIDQQMIHLGSVSIPTAVLALLPLNAQANPIELERDRRLAQVRRDIMYQAQRGMNETEFRNAVRAIRERKEKERKDAQNAGNSSPAPAPAEKADSSAR